MPLIRQPAGFAFFLILLCLGLLGVGCERAKQTVKDTKQGYVELEKLVADLKESLAAHDWTKARQGAARADDFLKSRSLGWYIQILATEEKEGIPAARALLEELRKTSSLSASEVEALTKMEAYFEDKGANRTVDYLFFVAAIAAEAKFPHGGGKLVTALRNKYHQTRNLPAPTTNAAPASGSAAPGDSTRESAL